MSDLTFHFIQDLTSTEGVEINEGTTWKYFEVGNSHYKKAAMQVYYINLNANYEPGSVFKELWQSPCPHLSVQSKIGQQKASKKRQNSEEPKV